MFNEETGNWEISKARLAFSELRLEIARTIPLDLDEDPSLSELAQYIETTSDVLYKIAKSAHIKLTGEDIPPSSAETKLGLSGKDGDDIYAYTNKEAERIRDKSSGFTLDDRIDAIAALTQLEKENYIEKSVYHFLDLKFHGDTINPQPEIGVDPVFDAMFQSIIDAYEETALKVTEASEKLHTKLDALQDPPNLARSLARTNTRPTELDDPHL